MINAIIELQTAIAIRHNASYDLISKTPMTKSSALSYTQNALLYKIATTQENSYRELLNKNIKRSFSLFA